MLKFVNHFLDLSHFGEIVALPGEWTTYFLNLILKMLSLPVHNDVDWSLDSSINVFVRFIVLHIHERFTFSCAENQSAQSLNLWLLNDSSYFIEATWRIVFIIFIIYKAHNFIILNIWWIIYITTIAVTILEVWYHVTGHFKYL